MKSDVQVVLFSKPNLKTTGGHFSYLERMPGFLTCLVLGDDTGPGSVGSGPRGSLWVLVGLRGKPYCAPGSVPGSCVLVDAVVILTL